MKKHSDASPWVRAAAREAYEAYTANSGGLAWDGRPCPTWDDLLEKDSPVCSHWCAAVEAVVSKVGVSIGRMLYSGEVGG